MRTQPFHRIASLANAALGPGDETECVESGGVLARRGHTEGAVDIAKPAGIRPAAVLCELMTRTGKMRRGPQAQAYARSNGFPILSIADLVCWCEQEVPVVV